MSSQKVHFTLSDEALEIIGKRADGPNKRGEWLSMAVVDYDRILAGIAPQSSGGALESLNDRLAQLEKQIAALLARLPPA